MQKKSTIYRAPVLYLIDILQLSSEHYNLLWLILEKFKSICATLFYNKIFKVN